MTAIELTCLITMWLILPPLGVTARYEHATIQGLCPMHHMSYYMTKDGALQIHSQYMKYSIPLPKRMDHGWLTYQLGDEYAYIGNCAPSEYPFQSKFCRRVMTVIAAKGWQ